MDFGDKRASRVNGAQLAFDGRGADGRGYAVRAIKNRRALRDLIDAIYKDCCIIFP